MNTPSKDIPSQDSTKRGKVPYATKEELREYIFSKCESSGAISHVDEDYYNMFVNLSEEQMTAIIMGIILDRAESINKICFDPNRKDKDRNQDIYKLITNCLNLIARGIMKFEDETRRLSLYKPIGNPPNEVMEQKIQKKIEESKPLIIKAFQEVFAEQKTQPT